MYQTLRLFIILSFFLSLSTSCETKKSITKGVEDQKKAITDTDENKMISLGFLKATIKDFSKEDGCGFLIVLDETEQVLQTLKPLDLTFQIEGLRVWIKYRPIRPIAPSCKKGTPIDIEEIKKA